MTDTPLPNPDKTGILEREPVAVLVTGVAGTLGAALTFVTTMGWWDPTEDQYKALLGLVTAVVAVVSLLARGKAWAPATVTAVVRQADARTDEANALAREAMSVAASAAGRPVAVGDRIPLNQMGGPGTPPPGSPMAGARVVDPSTVRWPVGGRDPEHKA